MRAVRAVAPEGVRFDDEAPRPGRPGRGEVLVAPTLCGICGTDVKEFLGIGLAVPGEPQVLGHEFAAKVVEVGVGVDDVEAGSRVAIMPFQHCGRCRKCYQGSFILCPNSTVLGLTQPGGGFADLVMVKSYQVTNLGKLTDQQGALIEPAAVSLNAVRAAGVGVGDTVLIAGAGPIGALAILAARAAGAVEVFVSEPNEARARRAQDLGCTAVLSGSAEEQLEELLERTSGYGVDRAIDCAGKDGTLALCVNAIQTGGAICVPSVRPEPIEVDMRSLTRKGATLVGSLGYTRETWMRTVQMISRRTYPVDRVVTGSIDRQDIIADGFEALVDNTLGHLKVLVKING